MKNILSKEEIAQINKACKQYNIENYTINSDGSINVDGNVNLGNKNLKELPLKFSKVSGDFMCYNNNLTSLKFSPTSVGGYFSCNNNHLTSLEFSPTSVGGDFYCYYNNLPDHFGNLYFELNYEERKTFIKYQHDLRIWEGKYNKEAAQDLYEEIKDGMR